MANEIVQHQGTDHTQERNYVHWDITTVCNFNCDYCYAMKEYKDNWNSEANTMTIEAILTAIRLSKLPIFLGLLGGEPTLSKHFDTIIRKLLSTSFFTGDNRLYITTNASKDLSWFHEFPAPHLFNNKLSWLMSYHSKEANSDDFVRKVKYLVQVGFKVKVNIMIDPDPKYWDDIKDTLIKLKTIDAKQSIQGELILHPHFVYENEHQLYSYPDNLEEYFGDEIKDIPKEFEQRDTLGSINYLNDLTIFTKNLNKFKGWNCWLNNYEIDLYGTVSKFCVQEKDSLLTNPLFFRNIKTTSPVICPHEECTCDGLLKVKKEKICA